MDVPPDSSPLPDAPADAPAFLFATCQVGAEQALKSELARDWPEFRFAYSRPGFLTFKLPPAAGLPDDFELGSVFARAHGFSLGQVRGDDEASLIRDVVRLVGGRRFDRVHVWSRDARPAGERGYLPGPSTEDAHVAERLAAALGDRGAPGLLAPAEPGRRVLDCVAIESPWLRSQVRASPPATGASLQWWIGYHVASGVTSRQPGGMWPTQLPEHAVSRAYLKLEEALRWSELPLAAGDRCAEIGAAPGGAAQALLDRGLLVMGVDPAEMHPRVLEHPNFTHVRKRGAEVRRREFRKTRWLLADLNVAPQYTLDTVEAIATHPEVRLHGLLLTLKLLDWRLADELPAYLERIRAWGFPAVRARQLQTGRQEVCVAAQLAAPKSRARRASAAGRNARRRS